MDDDLLHDCPGCCGTRIVRNMLACQDCRLSPPGDMRARLEAATPRRLTNPTEYSEAMAAVLGWFRANPPVREGR